MPYSWKAAYSDGEEVDQYSDDGLPRSTDILDHERLASFTLLGNENEEIATVTVDAGRTFVYRRRTRVTPGVGTRVCHVMGSMNGSSKDLTFAFEDGEVVRRKDWVTQEELEKNKGQAKGLGWYIAPRLRDHEK